MRLRIYSNNLNNSLNTNNLKNLKNLNLKESKLKESKNLENLGILKIDFIDLVYFSWTGNTRKVFECISNELVKRGFDVKIQEIKPGRDFPYPVWLFLSFIPGVGVGIGPIEVNSDILFLGMPKWTVNCPPITTFLNKVDLTGKTVFLVITYGGFDEKRYARSMAEKIKRRGGLLRGVLLVKRRKIKDGSCETIIRRFINQIEEFLVSRI